MMANENPPLEYQCRPCVGKNVKEYNSTRFIKLGTGKGAISHVVEPIEAAKQKSDVVFVPINASNKLYDFAYRDSDSGIFRVFQTTLKQSHSANANNIKSLESQVGGATKLVLYYLVPSARFPVFVTDKVDPTKEGVKCKIFHVSIPDPTQSSNLERPRRMI
jgi:hypothetical protein